MQPDCSRRTKLGNFASREKKEAFRLDSDPYDALSEADFSSDRAKMWIRTLREEGEVDWREIGYPGKKSEPKEDKEEDGKKGQPKKSGEPKKGGKSKAKKGKR